MNQHERKVYIPLREGLERARTRHEIAQERSPHNVALQEV